MKKKLRPNVPSRHIFLLGVFLVTGLLLHAQTPFTITWTGLGGAGTTNATGVPTGITIVQQYNGVTPSCVTTPGNGATTSYTAVIQAAAGYDVTITSIGGSAYGSSAGSKKFTLQLTNGAVYMQPNFTVIGTSSSCAGNTALNAFSVPVAGQTVTSGNQATVTVLRGIGGSESGGGYSYTRTLTITGVVTPVVACTAPTLSSVVTPVSCNGGSNGAVNLTATGGSTPYTAFAWSGPSGFTANTEDISGRPAGTYTVTVTATGGCTTSTTAVIGQPAVISRSIVATSPTCNGGSNGSLDLTVSGGTPGYTYSWSNSAATQDISNINAGSYTVTITDGNNCTSSISANLTQPSAIGITAVPTHISCFGNTDGSIDVTVSNAVGTPGYLWNTSATTEDISNLVQGPYQVTVTDGNGCTNTASVSINEPAVLALNTVSTDVACNSGATGSIDLSVTGGTGIMNYAWSNSATTEDIAGLTAGTYDVTVTDANGCTNTASATVSQPSALILNTTSTDVSCNGGNNGTIDLTVSGGTGTSTFNWSNSATTEDMNSLTAGTYDVTVTDANGCTGSATVNITEPSVLNLNAVASDVLCNGGADGSIDLTVSGGTGTTTYMWSNSAMLEDITNLSAGNYSVIVTDANGCTNTTSATINEPAALVLSSTVSGIVCAGGTNGAIDLTVTGGTGTITYNWNNAEITEDISNLSAGTYDVTVTDANGCTNTISVTLNQPAALNLTINAADISCNGLTDGSADLTVTGGTGTATYSWSTSEITEDIQDLPAGTYDVTVTDNNGCTATSSVSIAEPAALILALTSVDISCNGLTDGSADLTVSGGTGSMDFNWSNLETTEDISNLSAGSYDVTVTDANGCSNSASVSIQEPTAIVMSTTHTNVLCNGETNGAIDLTVSGGTGTLDFNWSNSAGTEDIAALGAGNYDVVVTDDNGCTNTTSVTITEPSAITASVNASSCTAYNSPSGLYTWSSSGIYTDTLTAANGCDSVLTINVTINTPDAGITVNDHTFTSSATGSMYQWVNCDNNFSLIAGATSQSYMAPSNGNFAVIVNKAGCVDTSACLTTFNTLVEENEQVDLHVYPNPNNGVFNLEMEGIHASEVTLNIMDITGKILLQKNIGAFTSSLKQVIEMPSIHPGVYLLSVYTDGKIHTLRFIVN